MLATLVSRVDCVVVDEFQDTNPLQFALVWAVTAAGVPTIVVGDLKQAIMAFQGADPRLFEALEAQNPDACQPLTKNWRSQPRLMEFVNALGPKLFGDEYIALAPQREETEPNPLEALAFTKKPKKAHKVRAVTVGERFRALLADPAQTIEDRYTKQRRRLKGSDLAVLCPTHAMLAEYSEVLRAQGHRVRLQADGWYTSRAVQITCNALNYLANPADRHAALTLAVTELGSLTLEEGLRQLMDAGRIDDPVLTQLDTLAVGVAERTIYALVSDAIAALGLFDTVMSWPDGEQQRANLLRLLAEAGEFMDANREALAYGGFHGAGVQTFLAWLAARVELKDGDKQPEPRVLDEDAIVLTTWHSAKGREWPVVAVCGLDKEVKAKLPKLGLGYRSFDDLSNVLEQARLEYAPKFAAPETDENFLSELQPVAEQEARRLLYVALTRARDKLLLECPWYLSDKGGTYWSILAEECGVTPGKDSLNVGDAKFPCVVIEGGAELPEDLELGSTPLVAELPVVGRRAIEPGVVPTELTPDSRTPSALALQAPAEAAAAEAESVQIERYGDGLALDLAITGTAMGTFLHRCFEVLGARPELALALPRATGVAVSASDLGQVTTAVARFEAWLTNYFKADVGAAGVAAAVRGCQGDGGVGDGGSARRRPRMGRGSWITSRIRWRMRERPLPGTGRSSRRTPQALEAQGVKVAGVAVNWVRRGEVVMRRVERC